MQSITGRSVWPMLVLGLVLALAGCGTKSVQRAPVEDRTMPGAVTVPPAPAEQPSTAARPPAGIENAGRPGYYTVKPGDTLIRIGLDNGQNWRDIARWNGLENPNLIEVGQTLRVIPPLGATPATAATPAPAVVVARPVASAPVTASPVPPAVAASGAGSSAAPAVASAPAPAPSSSAGANGDDDIAWIWPARGNIIGGFDEVKNKGLDIAGTLGEPVLAAADGRVVYVGAGLRGYGNLIIVKHNNTYLTAYAHNQTLLVKEDQTVRRGQKIAEMGSSDADRVKLHFEVRRQGKPVDPARYLPAR
ncbi:MAG: peptidoglycan DD-metalloendopeptidase family protein [Rhodoferax sp.]